MVDADIKGFFNNVNHEWMIKFLEVRIGDPYIIRLVKKLNKFNLEIEKTKSKLILFGKFAVETRKRRGFKNTETFDFLGFTHYCAKSKKGYFRVKRKTSKKKFRAKVKEFNQWIKSVRNKLHIGYIFNLTKQKLMGHYYYYGITDNSYMIGRNKKSTF